MAFAGVSFCSGRFLVSVVCQTSLFTSSSPTVDSVWRVLLLCCSAALRNPFTFELVLLFSHIRFIAVLSFFAHWLIQLFRGSVCIFFASLFFLGCCVRICRSTTAVPTPYCCRVFDVPLLALLRSSPPPVSSPVLSASAPGWLHVHTRTPVGQRMVRHKKQVALLAPTTILAAQHYR